MQHRVINREHEDMNHARGPSLLLTLVLEILLGLGFRELKPVGVRRVGMHV
jgi:hypothetical protein